MKKNVLGIIGLLSVVVLVSACGGGNVNNSNQQVQDLQKQIEELKQQVEQNGQSNSAPQQQVQQTQPVQQQVQQTQPVQQQVQQTQAAQQPVQPNQQPVQPIQPVQQQYGQQSAAISVETAKANAVAHAGLDINSVTFVKQKYDFDDGFQEWELEFVYGTTKYEYTVNAMTGAVMKFEMESIYN